MMPCDGRCASQSSCFSLAAIVNVAVAWAIGLWCEEARSVELSSPDEPVNRAFGTQLTFNYMSMVHQGDGSLVGRRMAAGATSETQPRIYTVHEVWAGFPVPSMRGRRLAIDGNSSGDWSLVISDRAIDLLGAFQASVLPLKPLWPGFAINTVFCACILWLLFAGALVLRRRRRLRCGPCPKCAYDLRKRPSDSSVCPECGANVALLNAA